MTLPDHVFFFVINQSYQRGVCLWFYDFLSTIVAKKGESKMNKWTKKQKNIFKMKC